MNRASKIAVVVLGVTGVVGTVATASAADSTNGKFTGCVDSKGGLRIIDPSKGEVCGPKTTQITWNEQGVQGLQGPAGPQGPAGTAPTVYLGDLVNVMVSSAQEGFSVIAYCQPGDKAIGRSLTIDVITFAKRYNAPVVQTDAASDEGWWEFSGLNGTESDLDIGLRPTCVHYPPVTG